MVNSKTGLKNTTTLLAILFTIIFAGSCSNSIDKMTHQFSPFLKQEIKEVTEIKKLAAAGFFPEREPEKINTEKKAVNVAVAEKKEEHLPPPAKEKPVIKAPPEKVEAVSHAESEPEKEVKDESAEVVEEAVVPEPEAEPIPEPIEITPEKEPVEIALIQKPEPEAVKEEAEEEPEENSDVWTEKELFTLETPEDRSFYRKKVFVSGKILDPEITDFSWKVENGESTEIETDYAGEFGFYIPTEELSDSLKVYMSAVKRDESRHDKLIVLFNRKVKPEVVIRRPENKYEFGKYLTVEGQVNIPGHQKYLEDLIEETRISLTPAGLDEDISLQKDGSFRHVINTDEYDIRYEQKLIVDVSLKNFKSGSESVEISSSSYSLVDYRVDAGNKSISLSWDNIPVKADYRIKLKSGNSEPRVFENIKSPVVLNSLENDNIYNIQLEAEEADNGIVLTGKDERVLPIDPDSLKPDAEGYFGRINVKWQKVKSAEKYNLLRKSVRTSRDEVLISSYRGNSYTDENVSPADIFSYSVEPSGIISMKSSETAAKSSDGSRSKIHQIINVEDSEKIKKVIVINNYAYSVTDNKILITDISDLKNPEYAGEINETADSLSVDEEYCYIVSDDKGLVLYNIFNPSNPVQIVRREQYKGSSVWSDFPFVFLSETGKGIRVLNFEDPEHPEKVKLYNDYSFSDFSVTKHDGQNYITGFNPSGKVSVFKIKEEGRLLKYDEIDAGQGISKAQSVFSGNNLITAVLSGKKIILFRRNEDSAAEVAHVIDSPEINDFNFFTAHDRRSFLAVLKDKTTDLYFIDSAGIASFFTSERKGRDDSVNICSDKSGNAYLVKSEENLGLYRIMTEGISYINNCYTFPDVINDFKITDREIIALTDSGIYSSDRSKYYPEPVLLSEGVYRRLWANSLYTAAVNNDYDYEIFPSAGSKAVTADNDGIRGRKAETAGDYSVILNEDNEIIVFSFDITKNAPKVVSYVKRDNAENIFTFSDKSVDYVGVINRENVEIFKITGSSELEKISEIDQLKAEYAICEEIDDSVFINIYVGNSIKRYQFSDGNISEIQEEINSSGNIFLFGNLIVRSEGEDGISIYKNIDSARTLVSRCSGIFSFNTKFSDGKIYSRGFNSIDEIVPVIPEWFK